MFYFLSKTFKEPTLGLARPCFKNWKYSTACDRHSIYLFRVYFLMKEERNVTNIQIISVPCNEENKQGKEM